MVWVKDAQDMQVGDVPDDVLLRKNTGALEYRFVARTIFHHFFGKGV